MSSIFGNISSEEHELILDMMIKTQYENRMDDEQKPIEIKIEEYDE